MDIIDEKFRTLLDEHFPKSTDALFEGASFTAAGMDSMSVVEFIVTMERHFGTPMLNGNELSGESTLRDARELLETVGVN